MEREIKFRGKSKLGMKPWITGFFLEDEMEQRFLAWKPDGDNFQITPIDYESAGQTTTLKDCNGKEIFEGDILKFPFDMGIAYVINDGFRFLLRSPGSQAEDVESSDVIIDTEVIGNIHDNFNILNE